MNEMEKITKLVDFLMEIIWRSSFTFSQEVHKLIWHLKALHHVLRYGGTQEYEKQLRISARVYLYNVRETAQQRRHPAIPFSSSKLNDLMVELGSFLDPEPPKPMRINELPLVPVSFTEQQVLDKYYTGNMRIVQVFFGKEKELELITWFGMCQFPSKVPYVGFLGHVICRISNVATGVGELFSTIIPVAVDLPSHENICSPVGSTGSVEDCDEFVQYLRDNWNNPNLFEPHDFVRVMDLKSPAYGMITTIQRKSLEPKKK
jgi:hypothetical protein